MKQIGNIFRQTDKKQQRAVIMSAIFFMSLFLGLFLGDGRQSVADVFGVATIIVLWLVRIIYDKTPIRQLSRSTTRVWLVFFAVVAVSLFFSDSVGLSISWCLRLVGGYAAYRLFYDQSVAEQNQIFVFGLLLFAGCAGLLSMVALVSPWLRGVLPPMNLVSIQFGHNHLADILVFITPILWDKLSGMTTKKQLFVAVVYEVLLVSTLARGAWVLVGLYAAYITVYDKRRRYRGLLTSLAAGAISIIVFAGVFLSVQQRLQPKALFGILTTTLVRPYSTPIRLEYWKQALVGLSERPLLGSGPGTFSLVSLRHQEYLPSASWYAHSFVLQLAAETGLLGLVVFGWLVWTLYHERSEPRRASPNSEYSVLSASIVLVLCYALFEFTLDYFVTWLLVWAVIGLRSGGSVKEEKETSARVDPVLTACFIFLGAFYCSWIVSNITMLYARQYDLAFLWAPYDATTALIYLDTDHAVSPTQTETRLMLFFHRKNPDVLYLLSREPSFSPEEAFRYAQEAAYADPQNMKNVSNYLGLVAHDPSPTKSGQELVDLLHYALPNRLYAEVAAIEPSAPHLGSALREVYAGTPPPLNQGYVSLLYTLGLRLLYSQPGTTERLWTLARDVYPDLATLHLELAGFYAFLYKNTDQAHRILHECEQYSSPRNQCLVADTHGLHPPGEYSEELR